MSDCNHKVTVRPWKHEATMVSLTCERCGDPVMVSLPSPPPGERTERSSSRGW